MHEDDEHVFAALRARGPRLPRQGRRRCGDSSRRAVRRAGDAVYGGPVARTHRRVLRGRTCALAGRAGLPRPDPSRARRTRAACSRVPQPRDRAPAGHVGQDRPQPRLSRYCSSCRSPTAPRRHSKHEKPALDTGKTSQTTDDPSGRQRRRRSLQPSLCEDRCPAAGALSPETSTPAVEAYSR